MGLKHSLFTALFILSFTITAYAANSPQTIHAFSESNTVVELTGSKIITDNFSFKMPERWKGSCVLVQNQDSWELYKKASYEENGSGLLFTISVQETNEYQGLSDYTILGFCGNKTYLLERNYTSTLEDSMASEHKSCRQAEKTIKKTFVSFIKDDASESCSEEDTLSETK